LAGKEKFLKEEQKVKVLFWEERPLMIELPTAMVFNVVQASPGVKVIRLMLLLNQPLLTMVWKSKSLCLSMLVIK